MPLSLTLKTWCILNSTLNDFGGNSTAYDAAVLKGRANPQLAVFLLLYNFLKDQTRVFLCCTRPYLRNVHYASVKEYFVNDALLWDSRYGLTVLKRRNFNSNASSQEALFNEYLSKYDLKWFCSSVGKNISYFCNPRRWFLGFVAVLGVRYSTSG